MKPTVTANPTCGVKNMKIEFNKGTNMKIEFNKGTNMKLEINLVIKDYNWWKIC